MTDIRALTEADWQLLRSIRLRALRDAPYAFISDYHDEAMRAERWWRERLRTEVWLLAFGERTAAPPTGMISTTKEHRTASAEHYINSLWVDPEHRRRRVGKSRPAFTCGASKRTGRRAVPTLLHDGFPRIWQSHQT